MPIVYYQGALSDESEESRRNWILQNTTFHQKLDDLQRYYLEDDIAIAVQIRDQYGRRVPKLIIEGESGAAMDALRFVVNEHYQETPLADA